MRVGERDAFKEVVVARLQVGDVVQYGKHLYTVTRIKKYWRAGHYSLTAYSTETTANGNEPRKLDSIWRAGFTFNVLQ